MKLSIKNSVRGLFGATALLAAHMAVAVPIELNATQFASQTAGLAAITEDFESFGTGDQSNPLALANGTAIFPGIPRILTANLIFCPNGSNCLIDNGDLSSTRTFSALAVGTTYWGTDIQQIEFGGDNTLRVTVVGGSGTLTVEATGRDFWGFHDVLGISSVSFLNLGNGQNATGNYGFDNVTTANSVPTPSTLALLAAGALWFGRRTRRSSLSPVSVTKEG
jgi:hypothetical protein